MATGTGGEWHLPSESPRVRWLLTVTEGVALGGVVAYLITFSLGTITIFTDLDATLTVGAGFLLLVILIILLRGIGLVHVARQSAPERPPAYQDWRRTRRWWQIIAIAGFVCAGSIAFSLYLWGWEAMVWNYAGSDLMLGATFIGLLLWAYTLHKIGGAW